MCRLNGAVRGSGGSGAPGAAGGLFSEPLNRDADVAAAQGSCEVSRVSGWVGGVSVPLTVTSWSPTSGAPSSARRSKSRSSRSGWGLP